MRRNVFFEKVVTIPLTIVLMSLYALNTRTRWLEKYDFGVDKLLNRIFSRKESSNYPDSATSWGKFFCWGLKNLISIPVAFLWLKKVQGLQNIPRKGPYLVIPNHQSYMDFMLIIAAFRYIRNLIFFVKKPYFDIPLWKFFLFPMGHLRADRHSVNKALKLLVKEGHPVVLFAEGTRTRDGKVGDAYPGFGRIAEIVPGIPIIPVGIKGAYKVWPWNQKLPAFPGRRVEISIGEALKFKDFEGSQAEFSELVMARIKELT